MTVLEHAAGAGPSAVTASLCSPAEKREANEGHKQPLTSKSEHSLGMGPALFDLLLCKAKVLSGDLAEDILRMTSGKGKLLA